MISFGAVIHNEQDLIQGMLNNISDYTDDIVIINQASTDDTLAKISQWCHETGKRVRIFDTEHKGYGDPDRTLLLSAGVYDWMMMIDADERIPQGIPFDELVAKGYDAINLPMRSLYFENDDYLDPACSYEWFLQYGVEVNEGYPDYHPRLLKKGTIWPSAVHDRFRAAKEYNAKEYNMLHLKTYAKQMEKNRNYVRLFPDWEQRLNNHCLYVQQSLNKPLVGLKG